MPRGLMGQWRLHRNPRWVLVIVTIGTVIYFRLLRFIWQRILACQGSLLANLNKISTIMPTMEKLLPVSTPSLPRYHLHVRLSRDQCATSWYQTVAGHWVYFHHPIPRSQPASFSPSHSKWCSFVPMTFSIALFQPRVTYTSTLNLQATKTYF